MTKVWNKALVGRVSAIALSFVVSQGMPALAKAEQKELTYGQFLSKVNAGQVDKVDIYEDQRLAKVRLEGQNKNDPPLEVKLFDRNPELVEQLRAKKVDFNVEPNGGDGATVGLLSNQIGRAHV